MVKRVEKNAKEEKNRPPGNGISSVEAALSRIESIPEAKTALKQLTSMGFNETTIAQIVLSYCGGTREQVERGLRSAIDLAKDAALCVQQLVTTAELVERVTKECDKRALRFHVKDQYEGELPEKMRAFADVLSLVAEVAKANTRNVRIGGEEKRDKKAKEVKTTRLNITSGREYVLAYFAYLISGGQKPDDQQYALIAPLVAAVRGDTPPDPGYQQTKAALRHAVTRFERVNRVYARVLRDQAKEDFENRQTLPLQVARR